MKKKEIASQKSTKASMARAARLSSKKAKLRKGKPVKTTGKPAKKSDAAPKSNGTAVKKPKIVKKGTGEKKVVKKGASEKKASDAPKMRLKRQLTPEEKEAMKTKKGKKYWELYKEMRKQFDEDKTKFDRMEAIGKRAKQLWETVRSEHTGADERAMKAKELYRLVRGRVSKIIKARDLSRVIESLMQFGDVEIRAGLFEELKSEIPELSKSVFAHFFVLKVLRYGSKDQREYVISSFRGSVPELMNHKIASTVVEVAYNDWANATQRGLLQQEFYSPAYAQFKDSSITSLEKALEAEGADKEKILEHLREKLDPIIEKGLIQHNLIQTLLFEYLTYCSEANRKDMIDSLKEVLIHMIHTREGARVAMHCIWNTNAKDRKLIMKSWKTHVARIAKDEHGYLALIAMLDAVDDTKALDKLILRELMTDVHDVALNEIGRKVILYLVAPRDTRFTHPDVIKILSKGDDNSNSKKEMAVRHKEVSSAVAKDLLTEVCSNVKRYMAENSATLVARVIVENCGQVEGSETLLDTLHTNLASLIALPFEPTTVQPKSKIDDEKNNKRGKKRKSTALLAMDTVLPEFMRDVEKEKEDRENDPELKMHVIERPATHLLIQHLLGLDAGKGSFSEKILEAVSDKDLQRWVTCNRGCFVVIKMLDTGMDKVVSKLKKRLKPCKTTFKSPNSKGAAILKKKLEF